jgi:hypothetical protein
MCDLQLPEVSHIQVSIYEFLEAFVMLINCCFSCSLACFKSHKENENCQQIQRKDPEIFEDRKPININVFTTVDTVPAEKLEELEKSDEIKALLKNPHLRNFLQEINSAPNSWNAMKLAMLEPLFLEFADACLKTVEQPETEP